MAETPAVDDVAEVEEGTDALDNDAAGGGDEGGKQGKTWYPYITKNQFEKFLARLDGKVPSEIDRDYVRAIIRTPSMIYRFLRGIEAMKLIDRDQKPTDRLHRLVDTETRSDAMREVVRDLYGDMLDEREGDDTMADGEITAFFRQRTGMGNDSASKMKMFFKYLMAEANLSDEETAPEPATPAPAPEPAPTPAAQSRRASRDRGGEGRQGGRSSSAASDSQSERSSSGRSSSAASDSQSERSSSGRSSSAASDSQGERSSSGSSRPLSEAQKAYLETVQKVVRIRIDGDWDDDMIRLAFDRLERLFERVKRG